jgi:hypothetical protein
VRWQEIFRGVDRELASRSNLATCNVLDAPRLLPNLWTHVIPDGVAFGAPGHSTMIASGSRWISLPGYFEIFGGSPTRCASNDCPPIATPTIVDELATELGQAAVFSSWPRIERAATNGSAVFPLSTGRHGGASRTQVGIDYHLREILLDGEGGHCLPPRVDTDYRKDECTAELALAYLRAARPRFLVVSLGDTDEEAHRRNYAGYLRALTYADAFVGRLLATLSELGDDGATTLIVTTDHGRAVDFVHHDDAREAERVWLLAVGGSVPSRGIVDSRSLLHLSQIAPTIRGLLGIPDANDRPIEAMLPEARDHSRLSVQRPL